MTTAGLNPDEIRARIDLAALVGSKVALKRSGDWSTGCCPFHGEKNPSFAVRHSTQRFNCFGCGAHGDCFDFVQKIDGLDFKAALARLAADAGVEGGRRYAKAVAPVRTASAGKQPPGGHEFAARKIWKDCRPLAGSQGEAYFRARGITLPLPSPTLRFHPGLRHGPSGLVLPAVVAAVCDRDRKIVGIWRIYLDPKEPKKAEVAPARMGLGPAARCAVRLAPLTDTIAVTEGIETGLAVLQMRPEWTVWSVLSAGGFRSFDPPPGTRRVAFCRDNDQASAVASMIRATELTEQGIQAACFTPEQGGKGFDFNDVLVSAA